MDPTRRSRRLSGLPPVTTLRAFANKSSKKKASKKKTSTNKENKPSNPRSIRVPRKSLASIAKESNNTPLKRQANKKRTPKTTGLTNSHKKRQRTQQSPLRKSLKVIKQKTVRKDKFSYQSSKSPKSKKKSLKKSQKKSAKKVQKTPKKSAKKSTNKSAKKSPKQFVKKSIKTPQSSVKSIKSMKSPKLSAKSVKSPKMVQRRSPRKSPRLSDNQKKAKKRICNAIEQEIDSVPTPGKDDNNNNEIGNDSFFSNRSYSPEPPLLSNNEIETNDINFGQSKSKPLSYQTWPNNELRNFLISLSVAMVGIYTMAVISATTDVMQNVSYLAWLGDGGALAVFSFILNVFLLYFVRQWHENQSKYNSFPLSALSEKSYLLVHFGHGLIVFTVFLCCLMAKFVPLSQASIFANIRDFEFWKIVSNNWENILLLNMAVMNGFYLSQFCASSLWVRPIFDRIWFRDLLRIIAAYWYWKVSKLMLFNAMFFICIKSFVTYALARYCTIANKNWYLIDIMLIALAFIGACMFPIAEQLK